LGTLKQNIEENGSEKKELLEEKQVEKKAKSAQPYIFADLGGKMFSKKC